MQDRIDEREETIVEKNGSHVEEVRVKEDHVAQQRESTTIVNQLIYLAASVLELLIGMRVFLRAIAANPNNPRHAKILATHPNATTVDWLDREPRGSPYTPAELKTMQEQAV